LFVSSSIYSEANLTPINLGMLLMQTLAIRSMSRQFICRANGVICSSGETPQGAGLPVLSELLLLWCIVLTVSDSIIRFAYSVSDILVRAFGKKPCPSPVDSQLPRLFRVCRLVIRFSQRPLIARRTCVPRPSSRMYLQNI
jgi:hypothetical protein